MRTLGCLGVVTFFLFMTLFIPLIHILTFLPFLFFLVAFCMVGLFQLIKGAQRS